MPPENPPQTPPVPTPPKPAESPLKQIRTFQGDVAAALSRQNESLFSIQQRERLRQSSGLTVPSGSEEVEASGRKKSLLLFLGTFILIALALVGGWFTYAEFVKKTSPPVVIAPESRLLSAESMVEINLSGLSRESLVAQIDEASADTKPNELRHLVLKGGSASSTSIATFLTALGAQAPGSLVRAFKPIFMLGTLGQSRFLLLKLASFENAFAGMLSWEKTLAEDIGPLFANGEAVKSIGSQSVFKDVISKNKDVRALFVGTSTDPSILYSFFDNDTLIITDRLTTLQTLIDRLTREKLTR